MTVGHGCLPNLVGDGTDGFHLWLLGTVVYLTLLETALLKTVEVQTEYLEYYTIDIQSFG